MPFFSCSQLQSMVRVQIIIIIITITIIIIIMIVIIIIKSIHYLWAKVPPHLPTTTPRWAKVVILPAKCFRANLLSFSPENVFFRKDHY